MRVPLASRCSRSWVCLGFLLKDVSDALSGVALGNHRSRLDRSSREGLSIGGCTTLTFPWRDDENGSLCSKRGPSGCESVGPPSQTMLVLDLVGDPLEYARLHITPFSGTSLIAPRIHRTIGVICFQVAGIGIPYISIARILPRRVSG
jgi:hypothetical protein